MSAGAPAALRPVRRAALHLQVADALRRTIMEGELEPGARLNERALCERFGVSRTPLREALKVLAGEGLVDLVPNRGAVVRPLDPVELAEAVEMMEALERLAGGLAAARASPAAVAAIRRRHAAMVAAHRQGDRRRYLELNQQIHLAIVDAAGNGILSSSYRELTARMRRYRYLADLPAVRWEQSCAEHEEIMARLAARDGAGLADSLGRHLVGKIAHVRERLAAVAETG